MAAVLDVDRQRDIAERLRERAETYRDMWRELSADAAALEAQLPENRPQYVTVKPKREPYEVIVREIAYELTQAGATFLTADVVAAGVPHQTALKWLKEWETRGMLSSVQIGRDLVWERIKHQADPINRPKREAPEARVIEFERSRTPVAGTGRSQGATDPGVRALIDQCRAKGAQVNKLRSGHWQVRKDGKVVGGIPATPSDHRSLPNCRADLRRNGLPV